MGQKRGVSKRNARGGGEGGYLNGMAKGISKRDIKGVTKKNGWGGVGGGYPKGSRGGGGSIEGGI